MDLSPHPGFAAFTRHLHLDDEVCPTCEQTIPNDRLEQVKARRAAQERDQENQLALKLKAERDQVTEQLLQQNEEALAKVRQEAEAKEAVARAEERRTAAAEAEVKVLEANAAVETVRTQAAELKKQLEESATAAAEKVNEARAEERRVATAEAELKASVAATALETVRSQADELKKQLEASAAATDEKVSAARDVALKDAEAALQPQLAAAQSATQQALEQARLTAEREEAARVQLNLMNEEKQAAVTAKAAAEEQMQALRDGQEKVLRDSIQETREALEKSHRDAVNAEQAKHFEEKQRIQNTVDDLKRQLENKTALELGEGAEVDLFEALKQAFPDDDITRIKRGVAGADIRHVVRHNSKDCGLILYDSKNHKAWRSDFVTKLRDDQIADKAAHAILSTIAFPQGTKQLHIQDGVILVNPARAVAIAALVRQQVVQAHCLNLGNEDREQKSLELYSFITSERFGTLLTKVHVTTDSLHQMDAAEQAAHNRVWQKRGQLINSVAKAEADLRCEIGRIIGTVDTLIDEEFVVTLADTTGTGAQ